MRMFLRRWTWRLAAAASGSLFLMQGCDADTRAAVEDGIINSSSSLLGAFLRAFLELSAEVRAEETTVRAVLDVAERMIA